MTNREGGATRRPLRIGEHLDSPWLILSPFLLITPLVLSGAVRCALGVSLPTGLVIAVVASALLVRVLGVPPTALRIRGWTRVTTLVWALGFSALLIRLLFNPFYGGLINGPFGVDSGNHAALFGEFIGSNPAPYNGFVGLYAVMYWLRPIVGGTFEALRASFYLAMLTIPFGLALGVAAATAELSARPVARWILLAAVGIVGVFLFSTIVYPILHYNQSDGFYSHLFGLFPFFLAWICYGLIDEPRRRAVVLLFWIALLRYVYGLNVADLLLSASVLLAADLGRDPVRPVRYATWTACLACAAGAFIVLRNLYPWATMDGFYTFYEYAWVVPACLFAGIVMSAAPGLLGLAEIQLPAPVRRMTSFAATFVTINGLLAVAFLLTDKPRKYYFYKFLLFSVLLTCCVIVILLARIGTAVTMRGWTAWLRSTAGRRTTGWTVSVVALLALAFIQGFRVYYPTGYERATGRPLEGQHPALEALYDPDADAIISGVLKKENKSFGGYLQPFFPRAYFMNAVRSQMVFGNYFDRWHAFHNWPQLFQEHPGSCYFFEQPPDAYKREKLAMAKQVEQLAGRPDKVCSRYRRRWRRSEVVELCSVCL
jgi:hypothetical protein